MLVNGADRKPVERSLASRLIEAGKLEASALDRILRVQASSEERLEALLVKLGLTGERDVAEAFARELGLAVALPAEFPDMPVLDGRISKKFLKQAGVVPLAEDSGTLTVAMIDPLDGFARRALEMASGKTVLARIALPSELEAAYARLYEAEQGAAGAVVDRAEAELVSDDELTEDVDRLRDLASEGPVIRLVNQLIARAVESRASDIHIEPFQNRLALRYRVDGILRDMAPPPLRYKPAIISRIKIMARLNIAERRLPQDGRIRIAVQGREFDLRVSTAPTLHGESVVMRILDRSSLVADLAGLGFLEESVAPFLAVLDQPQGILLVTGPTGSGKTTTLYTCLQRLNSPEKKLFTVEDPIEYQLEGVNQIQVKPQIGLSFAHVLRSILRQDPDIVMIGEMRDLETAQIGIQAALTGHLVLSTLHTNSAAATVTRLLDMGVEDYLVTSTITGVLAQRLVRKLCETCREPYAALPELVAQLRLADPGSEVVLHRPRGCEACRGSGYRGRIAVLEFLAMSDAIRRLVLRHAEAGEIHRAGAGQGMRSMYDDGLRKALLGVTSLEEVLRVTRDVGA
ncbi:MAG: type II secretion system ATPase GspE [Stellaceae bacterium]